MYLKARAQGKSESEAVDELVELAKLYPTQEDDTAIVEELVAMEEQDLSIPVAKLDNFKRQHVNVTVGNKKLFSDSPTTLGMISFHLYVPCSQLSHA